MTRSPLARVGSLLEAIYSLDLDALEWQRRIAAGILERRAGADGLLAYEFDASGECPQVGIGTVAGVGEIGPLAGAADSVHSQDVADDYRLAVARGTHVGTTRELLADAGRAPSSSPVLRGIMELGYHDTWAVCAVNPDATGIAFSVPLIGPHVPDRQTRHEWTRIGIHIAAAHRLRRTLASGVPRRPAAILDPGGAEQDLAPAAVPDRDALRRFVRALDRERARDRRGFDTDLLSLWQGLLNGRWSVVDEVESDGRRHLLFYENEPEAVGPHRLTGRERQVATYAAQGHANKKIAYQLGIHVSTVATHLRSALRKLGLSARTDLVWLYGRLADGAPETSDVS